MWLSRRPLSAQLYKPQWAADARRRRRVAPVSVTPIAVRRWRRAPWTWSWAPAVTPVVLFRRSVLRQAGLCGRRWRHRTRRTRSDTEGCNTDCPRDAKPCCDVRQFPHEHPLFTPRHRSHALAKVITGQRESFLMPEPDATPAQMCGGCVDVMYPRGRPRVFC